MSFADYVARERAICSGRYGGSGSPGFILKHQICLHPQQAVFIFGYVFGIVCGYLFNF